MKIDKTVYKYIEYELFHYDQYKKEIDAEREAILEGSSVPSDGMPRGNSTGNPTESKGIRLVESTFVLAAQRKIRAVDNALKRLSPLHYQVFQKCYLEKRNDRYKMSDELHISYETLNRYKNAVVLEVAKELGINLPS